MTPPPRLPFKPTLGAALVALSLLASCRDATQITLNVRTNVPCTEEGGWRGIAIYVGKPGAELEKVSPTLVTRQCDASGNVGSLVVVPSGSKDEEVGIRVVGGLTVNPEQCEKQSYDGCIVARRTVRFNPHDSLDLDVELTSDCVSIGCDVELTCVAGSCLNTRVANTPLAAPPPAAPAVRCGDNGIFCATSGDVCCLSVDTTAQTTFGDCRPPDMCPSTSVVLYCDDETDCPSRNPDGVPGICHLSYEHEPDEHWTPSSLSGSDCNFASSEHIRNTLGLALCQTRNSCAINMSPCFASHGEPNRLPGYFWCELTLF